MSQFLLQLHSLQTLTKPSKLQSIPSTCFSHHPILTTFPQKPTIPSKLRLSLRSLLPSNGSGKLVEQEEGNFALWLCYILTGVGANLVSWLVLPRNAVSIAASGAVFGLFTISVLVKMSWDWRKILEVLILGQFVLEKVLEAAQASTALSGSFGRNSLMNVNHTAHLSGALVGVFLVWIISKVPSEPPSQEGSSFQSKVGRTRL